LNNHIIKKSIDSLDFRLDQFERLHLSSSSSSSPLSPKQREMMRDPRQGYQEHKGEKFFHPSAMEDKCDELNEADEERVIFFNDHDVLLRLEQNRCRHSICNWECIPECPYFPDEGIETHDHEIHHKGSEGYDRKLKEWQQFLLLSSSNNR
jgi:hypothetical protein